jgi:hypothetical protein
VDLIYFILCSAGLTALLTDSKILEPIRPKHYFFKCSMCMGFWVGLFFWGINQWTSLFAFGYSLVTGFCLACVSSATSYWLSVLIGDGGIRHEAVDDPTCSKM